MALDQNDLRSIGRWMLGSTLVVAGTGHLTVQREEFQQLCVEAVNNAPSWLADTIIDDAFDDRFRQHPLDRYHDVTYADLVRDGNSKDLDPRGSPFPVRLDLVLEALRMEGLRRRVLVEYEHAAVGTEIEIGKLDGHQKRLPAKIVAFAHYDPKKERPRS